MNITRVCIVAWGLVVVAAVTVPDSTPFWARIVIAAVVAAPVVAALIVWPILLVRGLPEVTAPTGTQETRIQVLPALSSGQDENDPMRILEREYGIVGRPHEDGN